MRVRAAVVAARLVGVRGEGAVPFTPPFAAPGVRAAPRWAARTVPLGTAGDSVAPAVCRARSLVRLAVWIASIAVSVASEEAERTRLAVVRVTFEPVGETLGFLRPSAMAMTSPSVVT